MSDSPGPIHWRLARKGMPESPPSKTMAVRWRPILLVLLLLVFIGAIAQLFRRAIERDKASALSSVVVLPFLDLSPQKDQEYFSDGLTEEIIDALSRVPKLRVVARTSAFAFKGKNTDIRQIGQLNVDAVLEGSVRKDGDKLRITAQLNRVSDGTHLWSRTFDRQLRDIFATQREISQSIADQLRAGQIPERPSTTNLAAYDLYQEGRYFLFQSEQAALPKARDRFQKAISLDPKFALAYAGLADTYAYQAELEFGTPAKEVMPKAKEYALQAIAIDETCGEAHTSLGIVLLEYEWNYAAAQHEFWRAMQLNPSSGYVHHWYAHSLEAHGNVAEALGEMRASLALDPLSTMIRGDVIAGLISEKKYDEALKELTPADPFVERDEAFIYQAKGEVAGARLRWDRAMSVHPEMKDQPKELAFSGVLLANEGHLAEARQILDRLEEMRKAVNVDGFTVVPLCSVLGDHDRMRLWAQRAYDARSRSLVYAPVYWKQYYAGDPVVEALVAKAHTNL